MLIEKITYQNKELFETFVYNIPLFIQEITDAQNFDKDIQVCIDKYTTGYENLEIRKKLDQLRIPSPKDFITFHGKDSFLGFSVSLNKRIAIKFDKHHTNTIYKVTVEKGDLMLILFKYSKVYIEYEIYLGLKPKSLKYNS